MQVSFLKDLATMRNPRSEYGFLSYLQDRGRLVDFVNLKDFFPTRVEFHDYLEWVARKFADQVRYDTCVQLVLPVESDGEVIAFDVVTANSAGDEEVIRTRNVVIGSGLAPHMPDGTKQSVRVWHSSEVLHQLAGMPDEIGADPEAIAVVGAGQSAAEIAAHLHDRFPHAQIYAVLPRYGYSVADNTPFANRVFDPTAVDEFYRSPPAVKESFFAYHRNTNYSVVDASLIDELYRRVYRESVLGRRRLHVLPLTSVTEVEERPDGVVLRVESRTDGKVSELSLSAVVFATGYDMADPTSILGPAADVCLRTDAGQLLVRRDYRVETIPGVTAGIYLQGATEHSHGISASLLSNVAVRAWDIVESLAAAAFAAA